jgi:uncharacterized membrane protein
MAKKQFKIGECAIGGIIEVNIGVTSITIKALEYVSKKSVVDGTFDLDDKEYWNIKNFLYELTSSYYTDEIMKYIEKNSNLEHQMFRKY